jgi:uncharacterized protein (TIGR02453 family)
VRFSKNKEPYKNNFGASFSKGAKKINAAGYYFHLYPGASFIGGGLWMPEAPDLQKLRQEIDYSYKEFKSILGNAKFKNTFGSLTTEAKLSRPPKGYDIDNPAIEFLKLKSFTAIVPIADKDIFNENMVKQSLTVFKTLSPLVQFLNRAIDLFHHCLYIQVSAYMNMCRRVSPKSLLIALSRLRIDKVLSETITE